MPRDQHSGITEQRKASLHRREDALVLYNGKRWRGAMYVAGYSVECLIKAKLMQRFGCRGLVELEDELRRRRVISLRTTVFTHQLEVLLELSGSMKRLQQEASLWRQFNLVNRWVPAWRYNPNLSTQRDARDFLNAAAKILHWLEVNV